MKKVKKTVKPVRKLKDSTDAYAVVMRTIRKANKAIDSEVKRLAPGTQWLVRARVVNVLFAEQYHPALTIMAETSTSDQT